MKRPVYRASFALLCWAGAIALGLQTEVLRLGDNPFALAFLRSQFWGGIGLTCLMLFSVACRPVIQNTCAGASCMSALVLVTLIFLAQGISGPRDLFEIPLSWQNPTIHACDYKARTCRPPAPGVPPS